MTDNYLTTILEEAEHVAEQHDQVARTADNQAHEWLRYAVLRILEGQTDHLPTNWTAIDGVTVGYGTDDAMFDSWGSSEDWWETVPPQEACTRFRVFFPDDHQTVPRDIVGVMAALGAWRVWTGSAAACGSYDHRERREVHYLWPEGHPVEEILHKRLSGPAEAVAPDGGRTRDVRDRLVVDENAESQDDLEPRTKRAVAEAMDVSLLSKGGCYEVQSSSGNRYEVDVIDESCTCPDWQQRSPKAAASTCAASITRSNGAAFPDQTAAFPPRSCGQTTPRDGLCRYLVGPGRTLRDTDITVLERGDRPMHRAGTQSDTPRIAPWDVDSSQHAWIQFTDMDRAVAQTLGRYSPSRHAVPAVSALSQIPERFLLRWRRSVNGQASQ